MIEGDREDMHPIGDTHPPYGYGYGCGYIWLWLLPWPHMAMAMATYGYGCRAPCHVPCHRHTVPRSARTHMVAVRQPRTRR